MNIILLSYSFSIGNGKRQTLFRTQAQYSAIEKEAHESGLSLVRGSKRDNNGRRRDRGTYQETYGGFKFA